MANSAADDRSSIYELHIRGKGHAYKTKPPQLNGRSSPHYTPSNPTLHLPRPHARVYRASRITGPEGDFLVKLVDDESRRGALENEYLALVRIDRWRRSLGRLGLFPPIAPALVETLQKEAGITPGVYFWVSEYLDQDDKDKNWKPLSKELQEHGALCKRSTAGADLFALKNALVTAVEWLHRLGIVHGDLKDEHILVRCINDKADFSQVRLIDFGFCYRSPALFARERVVTPERWQGGSIGFSHPRFWKAELSEDLGRGWREEIDWYSVAAVLYYAFTGRCFGMASPAGRYLSEKGDDAAREYRRLVEQALRNQMQADGGMDRATCDLMNVVVQRLAHPESRHGPLPGAWTDQRQLAAERLRQNPLLVGVALLAFGGLARLASSAVWLILTTTMLVLWLLYYCFQPVADGALQPAGGRRRGRLVPYIGPAVGVAILMAALLTSGVAPDPLAMVLAAIVTIGAWLLGMAGAPAWLPAVVLLALAGPLIYPPAALALVPLGCGLVLLNSRSAAVEREEGKCDEPNFPRQGKKRLDNRRSNWLLQAGAMLAGVGVLSNLLATRAIQRAFLPGWPASDSWPAPVPAALVVLAALGWWLCIGYLAKALRPSNPALRILLAAALAWLLPLGLWAFGIAWGQAHWAWRLFNPLDFVAQLAMAPGLAMLAALLLFDPRRPA